jgi:hypothetical protein
MSVDNIKAAEAIAQRLDNERTRISVRKTQLAFTIKNSIMNNLQEAIGDKSKHFIVVVEADVRGLKICVKTKDAVGQYIYYGTKGHSITSPEPMPVGNDNFARSASHPGTKAMKSEIDQAVRTALAHAKMIARSL